MMKANASLAGLAAIAMLNAPLSAQTFTITTVAGGGSSSTTGVPATNYFLVGPTGVAVDSAGNLYIADQGVNRVYKVSTAGMLTAFAGQETSGYQGDGGPAVNALLNEPYSVIADNLGNVYISDDANSVVRKVAPNGIITTFAGNGQIESSPGAGDGGPATSAELSEPEGLAVDNSGNLYIADSYAHRVRLVAGNIITTFAGDGLQCCSGEGGPAVDASISAPAQVSLDASGNLLIAESNCVVHKVSGGILSRFAGTESLGYTGDGGPATSAQLSCGPAGVVADAAGNVYIADTYNNVIRMVNSSGIITTIAGSTNGNCGYTGDGGPAASATLCQPMGLAISGNRIYIADNHNAVVRMLTPVAGTGGQPGILTGGILNAASYAVTNGAGAPVAPGSLVAIFTSQLASQAGSFTGTTLAPSINGVSVTFNGITAPIVTVSPTGANPYVSAQVPFEVLGSGQTSGSVPAVINVNGSLSPAAQASIVPSAPGIFTIPATGQGNAILVYTNPATNAPAIAAPSSTSLGYATAPIPRGTNGFFYVTGLGAMTPQVPDGSGACPAASGICNANATPAVTVGGVPAKVAFAGQAPGYPGVFQVNITVPLNAPTGNSVALVVTSADGSVTSNMATIAVQ
jgi:uncharacterized protein (TIGR03437 family)